MRSLARLVVGHVMAVLPLLWPAHAGAVQGIDRSLAREYFTEAEALSRADGGSLWNAPVHGPLLFVDRVTREVVANMADSTGLLREAEGVWVGTWPEGMGVWNGSVEYGGAIWTMLGWPLPTGRHARRVLLAHEMFHRLQRTQGWPSENPGNSHLDSEAGRSWLRLEWRALQAALSRTEDARRDAIRDALLFRTRRQRQFAAGAAEERALELNEGLAEYTGVVLAIEPNARDGWLVRHLDNHDANAERGSVVRNFAYASGPAYGVLLDAAMPTWRDSVREQGDFGEMLARAYDIDLPENVGELPEQRAVRYDGMRLFADEAARNARRLAQLAEFRTRFAAASSLRLPALERFSFTFDPNAVVPFDESGTVYLTTTVRDDWGTLTVTAGGALMVREDGRVTHVLIPAPSDAATRPVRGDGWQLELAEGWEIVETDRGWTVRSSR